MGIFDDLKSAATILKEAGKIEQYRQILEVQGKLLEMQDKIAELEDENKDLKEKLKIKGNLIYKGNAYWINEGGKEDGSFCTRCWDKNKETIRLNPRTRICPECKTDNFGREAKVWSI